jgi:polyhydroxyalkanoate synthase
LLHLTLAMLRSSASLAGSMSLRPGFPNWNDLGVAARAAPEFAAAKAAPDPSFGATAPGFGVRGQSARAFAAHDAPEAAPNAALAAEAAFLAGIQAWRAFPWHRDLPDPPTVWREGTARLLDYGGDGPPVLFVPSLVNRWTVLDLMPGHSMLRWLADQGVHPTLLDWGEPEPAFTLTDHIAGRLVRAMQAAVERSGKVVLAGYCMGGTFATAAAALRPDLVSAIALLAAPWDFHAGDVERLHKQTATCAILEPLLRDVPMVPVDLLQTLFALDDPLAVAEKFRQFGRLDPDSDGARLFVALEDWLNDGVPLSGTTARECLREWYRDNLPMRGEWRVAGLGIDPASIRVPAFVAVPRRDRIVPPESARALARLLPNVTLVEPPAGHVGMTTGRGAVKVLWEPLRDWLRTIDGGAARPPRRSARGNAKHAAR